MLTSFAYGLSLSQMQTFNISVENLFLFCFVEDPESFFADKHIPIAFGPLFYLGYLITAFVCLVSDNELREDELEAQMLVGDLVAVIG